jgi:hypothetical protein
MIEFFTFDPILGTIFKKPQIDDIFLKRNGSCILVNRYIALKENRLQKPFIFTIYFIFMGSLVLLRLVANLP